MRFVIYGAGAIGGVVGARLHQSGHDVALIARGEHLRTIRRQGLTLQSPVERSVLELPAAEDPEQLGVGAEEDVILLAVKGQDTPGALAALRGAGTPASTPIVCLQNGVENERLALRMFARVYGAVIMLPAAHLEPGVVLAYGAKATGIIDIGRYPTGSDELCEQLAAAFRSSQLRSHVWPDVMRLKYAKLLLNLGNAVDALCAPGEASDELTEQAQAEGRAVLVAAEIDARDANVDDLEGRWERIGVEEIDGQPRAGSSSWQSLARGTGAIETDFLNGEIVLLGRLHGIPTPLNTALSELAARHARAATPPGSLTPQDILAAA
ncbi:MAG: ketopantoate reductase family protein [Solirubrobacteraceae bacterium]